MANGKDNDSMSVSGKARRKAKFTSRRNDISNRSTAVSANITTAHPGANGSSTPIQLIDLEASPEGADATLTPPADTPEATSANHSSDNTKSVIQDSAGKRKPSETNADGTSAKRKCTASDTNTPSRDDSTPQTWVPKVGDKVLASYGRDEELHLAEVTKQHATDGSPKFNVLFLNPEEIARARNYHLTISQLREPYVLDAAPPNMTANQRKAKFDAKAPGIDVGSKVFAKLSKGSKQGYLPARITVSPTSLRMPWVVWFFHSGEIAKLRLKDLRRIFSHSAMKLDCHGDAVWPSGHPDATSAYAAASGASTLLRTGDLVKTLRSLPRSTKHDSTVWQDIKTLPEADSGPADYFRVSAFIQTEGMRDLTHGVLDVSSDANSVLWEPAGADSKTIAVTMGRTRNLQWLFVDGEAIWIKVVTNKGIEHIFAIPTDIKYAALQCVRRVRQKFVAWEQRTDQYKPRITRKPTTKNSQSGKTVLAKTATTAAHTSSSGDADQSASATAAILPSQPTDITTTDDFVYGPLGRIAGKHALDMSLGHPLCELCGAVLLPAEYAKKLCEDCMDDSDYGDYGFELVAGMKENEDKVGGDAEEEFDEDADDDEGVDDSVDDQDEAYDDQGGEDEEDDD